MSTKSVTGENAKSLVANAEADAATIVGIFRGHDQKMNRVYETLKARTASFTFEETLYYLPKLKAALRAAGFNPGTLGRIWAACKWATESGMPLSGWATYMGKKGLDAAHEEYKAANRATKDGGRKPNKTTEPGTGGEDDTTDPQVEADVAMAQHKSVKPLDAILTLLDNLSIDDLTTLALVIESRIESAAEADAGEEFAEAA